MENRHLYKVRYVVINSNDIYNECGPISAGPVGWDSHQINKRKIAAERYVKRLNDKNGFYIKLEDSILKNGVRNPILASAGWVPENKIKRIPPYLQNDIEKALVCHHLGGSRLWIAQKHNLMVPCLVSDFVEMFPNAEHLMTEEQVMDKFMDKPRRISFSKYGLTVSNLPQVHLGK